MNLYFNKKRLAVYLYDRERKKVWWFGVLPPKGAPWYAIFMPFQYKGEEDLLKE